MSNDSGDHLENDDDGDLLVSCWGPPRCTLKKADQKKYIESGGCIWCEKIYFDKNGNPIPQGPGEA